MIFFAFIDDFRCQKAECFLKDIYKKMTGMDGPKADQITVKSGKNKNTRKLHYATL